ncbi:MAG: M24B family metallopeptidase, partial [Pyrinomonadaceae bacterium]
EVTSEAHCEAMKHARKASNEYEIEALIEYIFRKNGASMPSYGSIIGGGKNATVLHYTGNNAPLVNGELLLVDAGAEFEAYAADITRTFPINGRFSVPQQKIYEAVLDVQMRCIEKARPGVKYSEINDLATRLLTEQMVRLRLLSGDVETLIEQEKQKEFYMHGIGHFLGMDVHDVGSYITLQNDAQNFAESRKLEPSMVLTIEPGLYIDHNSSGAPSEYRGIGVRIEDDILITETGNRVLTGGVPKTIEEIEKLMAWS